MVIKMNEVSTKCIENMKIDEDMNISQEEQDEFNSATTCYACKRPFENNSKKCRDHDHRTGCYRGAAHDKCNINQYCKRFIPVVMHNFKGYDSHLIIQKAFNINKELGKKLTLYQSLTKVS